MKRRKRMLAASLLFLLLFSGCAGGAEERAAPETSEALSGTTPTVTVNARFQREDETPLPNGTVRISDGETSVDYSLDEEGTFQAPGLPANGSSTWSLLKETQEETSITVRFSTGAVIDAATNADGVGCVTVKEDTEEIALIFTLNEDGALSCSLQLS